MKAPGILFRGTASLAGAPLFPPLQIEIGSGQWTCLLGPSGVGKTTILRLIAGLDSAADFTGEILGDDRLPLQGRIAYMAQSDLLLPWLDVTDNVCLGARLRGEPVERARAAALISRVGLEPHHHKRPQQLSGGQRQRAALARTLMEERPVILLDEPFSALDARTRAEMQDLAAELLVDATVLLVTHDPGEAARLGHRIYLLTEQGMETMPPPDAATPRRFEATDTLACQAGLLRRLRRAA